MKIRNVAVPAVALLLGLGVGLSGQAQAEPEVITETVTERVEVPVTPSACAEAIAIARENFALSAEAVGALAVYPDLIPRAFAAGATVDEDEVYAIVDEMTEATDTITSVTSRLDADGFNRAAAACEASGADL